MKKNESSVTYEVCVTFGSEFQRNAAEKSLHNVIQTWADFYARKHKGNRIVIEQKRVDVTQTHKGPQGVC